MVPSKGGLVSGGDVVAPAPKQSPKPWKDLSGDDQTRLVLTLGSLTEFAAGFNIVTSFTQYSSNPQDAPIRFLYQSLHQYLYAYYMDQPANGLFPVLESLDMSDQAKRIADVLGTYIAPDTTLKAYMKKLRNAVMSHPRFTVKSVFGVYSLAAEMDVAYFQEALHMLLWETWQVHQTLRDSYPEAVELDRQFHAVDNPA